MAAQKAKASPGQREFPELDQFSKGWKIERATHFPPGAPQLRVASYKPAKYRALAEHLLQVYPESITAIVRDGSEAPWDSLNDAMCETAAASLLTIFRQEHWPAVLEQIASGLTYTVRAYIIDQRSPFTDADRNNADDDKPKHSCKLEVCE